MKPIFSDFFKILFNITLEYPVVVPIFIFLRFKNLAVLVNPFIKIVFFCRSTSGSEPDNIAFQVQTGGTWRTGNDYNNRMISLSGSNVQTYNGNGDNRVRLDRYGAETNFQGTATIFNVQSTTHPKVFEINYSQFNNSLTDFYPVRCSGGYQGSDAAISGLRFYTYASNGSLEMKWAVYGQKC